MEKLTKRDYFNILRDRVADDRDLVAFIDHELALLEKKNARRPGKPTPKQAENIALADAIYEAMESGHSYTVTEIKGLIPALAEANPQKVSALVTKMRNELRVSRELVKGKAYFTKI